MDEGEEDGTEAFDFDYDVAVLFDSLHVAFLPQEGAAGNSDFHAAFEVGFGVDFAAGGIVGSQQAYKVDFAGGDFRGDRATVVAVNPEERKSGKGVA